MKRVLIFTEGGLEQGLGHIARCSALYEESVDRNIYTEMIVYGEIGDVNLLKGMNVTFVNWLSINFLKEFVTEEDYCIIDSYMADHTLYDFVADITRNVVFIDDYVRINYPKGIIVNPSLHADRADYGVRDNKLLLGNDYVILRTPFIQVNRKKMNKKVKQLLLIMGGTDIRGLTPKLIAWLQSNYPELILNVVAGKENKNFYKDSQKVHLHKNITAQEMKELMLRSDIAITAAGQTIHELMATQTPFIAIKVADNQLSNKKALEKLFISCIDYNNNFLFDRLETELNLLMTFANRKKIQDHLNGFIDGLGIERIINNLIEHA